MKYEPKLGDYMPTLLHCPFCGAQPVVHVNLDIGDQPGAGCKVGCGECDIWQETTYASYFPIYDRSQGHMRYIGHDDNKAYASMVQALVLLEATWNTRRTTPAKVFYVRETEDLWLGAEYAKPGWYAGTKDGDHSGPFRWQHEALRDPLA